MKLKYRKLTACLTLLGVIALINPAAPSIVKAESSSNTIAAAQNSDERIIQQKATADVNKAWNINFNSEIDFNSVKDSIQVNEINNNQLGASVPVTVIPGASRSVRVAPPVGGYKKGQIYQVTIRKGAKAKKNKDLCRNNTMKFSIMGENSGIAKVEVSPVVNMFKSITINATTRPDVTKYKVEGNEKLFNIGETSVNVLENKNNVQVYFYGADGYTMRGKTTIDVNKTANDLQFQIQ